MPNDNDWQVSKEFAIQYESPLDRRLYCDEPLIKLLGNIANQSILDLGCGNGGLTRILAQKAGNVVGIDSSEEMLKQARLLLSTTPRLQFQKTSAENLPFDNNSFNKVVACMLINTISKEDTVINIFKETRRILKQNGRFFIAMAHPLTLSQKTRFRWTEWEKDQSQQTLMPGESFKRKFIGKDGKILSVTNNYWPPDVLINFAERNKFSYDLSLEPKATQEDLKKYPELDPILATVPLFLLMAFDVK